MSKRAEELFAKIARGKPSTLTGQWREPYTPQEEIALIDAELRKERERAAERIRNLSNPLDPDQEKDAIAAIIKEEA